MGQLVDGQWRTENILVNHDDSGLYFKRPSIFRSPLAVKPSPISRSAGPLSSLLRRRLPMGASRHLMRTLKKLEPFVTLTNTFQEPDGQGWSFGEAGHVVPGTDRRVRWLHELS